MFWKKEKVVEFNQEYNLPLWERKLTEKERREYDHLFRKRSYQKELQKGREIVKRILESSAPYLTERYGAQDAFELAFQGFENMLHKSEQLEKINQDNQRTINSLADEIKKLRILVRSPSQKIEQLEQINKQLFEKSQKAENEAIQIKTNFKNFIISEFELDPSLKGKDIDFLIQLVQEKKKLKNQEQDNENEFKEKIVDIDPYTNDYIKSEKCVCGLPKYYGSKGCEKCKVQSDRLRKRLNLSRQEAWEKLWESLGIKQKEEDIFS
ncbi:MAG TPA: hypothetical protein P5277_01295 [Candidatus Paceibacterota bacterium]|nr:hypothetical protein [Candidatus Paceibacterota bacterium]